MRKDFTSRIFDNSECIFNVEIIFRKHSNKMTYNITALFYNNPPRCRPLSFRLKLKSAALYSDH